MRDALSLLDQSIGVCRFQVTYDAAVTITGGIPQEQFQELAEAVLEQDIGRALDIVDSLCRMARVQTNVWRTMLLYFRDLLMALMAPHTAALQERLSDVEPTQALAERFGRRSTVCDHRDVEPLPVEMKYAAAPDDLGSRCAEVMQEKSRRRKDMPLPEKRSRQLRAAVQKLQPEVTALKEGICHGGHMAGQMPGSRLPGTKARTRRERHEGNPASSIRAAVAFTCSSSRRTRP